MYRKGDPKTIPAERPHLAYNCFSNDNLSHSLVLIFMSFFGIGKNNKIPYPIFLCLIFFGQFAPLLFAEETAKFNREPVIIDIRGAIYARLDLFLESGNNFNPKKPLSRTFLKLLEKNLRWSGLFNVHDRVDMADVRIQLSSETSTRIRADILTPENVNLFSSQIVLFENKRLMEEEILRFINELSLQLTGERTVLGTAIIYSEQVDSKEKYLVLANTHGYKRRILIQDGNYNLLPRWTPDGKGIVYTSTGWEGTGIYEFDLLDKEKKIISQRKGISSGGTWGPNKKELIITISKKGNADLYRVDRKGTILERLTYRSSIETTPSWSPDGKSLLFVSNRSGSVQVYQKDLEAKETVRMTFEGNYNTDPRWSKDGAYIAYAGMVYGKFQVFLMDRDGEHVRQLTNNRASSEQPEWSPDGRQFIYTSEVNGDQKIFIMTTDGAYKRRLTNTGKGIKESNPTWTRYYQWPNKVVTTH